MTTHKIEVPPKLIPVFTGEARYRGARGGRGSGKSRTFAKMTAVRGCMWATAGLNGVILCGREFQNSLDDSSFAEVREAIRSDPWLVSQYEIGRQYIRHLSGRIEYVFSGLRHNIESLKGKARILLAWIDEAEQVSEQSWQTLIPTVREEGSEIWLTWNPASAKSDTHKRFVLEATPDMKIVELNWRDNPWFPKVLDEERQRDLVSRPDDYDHIWEGGFRTNLQGAYYAADLNTAKTDNRIRVVPHDPALPVKTYWDLGLDDATSIWFTQEVGSEIRLIRYREWSQAKLTDIASDVLAYSYTYADHILPHDVRVRELITGRSREEVLRALLGRLTIAPSLSVEDGINAVRTLFPRFVFDEANCADGLEALRNYAKRWDDKRKVFEERPFHNWASHAADAIRYLGVTYRERLQSQERHDPYRAKGRRASAWAR
jgi:phage terminase large subunit